LITYCTNIHPGESWEEIFTALREHIPTVKAAISPTVPFPIGLRLSRRAADELAAVGADQFRDWLREHDCFVPTMNGFPFGSFHGERIKERVYLPDWRSPERVDYTKCLADLLAGWLPAGGAGSISTVPLGFKGVVVPEDLPLVRGNLIAALIHLERIRQRSGKTVLLALEPEPGCLLETTTDVCRCFDGLELPSPLSDLLGVCYDCCHQAVEFESPAESLSLLKTAGIPIAKVQVSSALAVAGSDAQLLSPFVEQCYLHQVVIRHQNGALSRYVDLPQALNRHPGTSGDEWRCHFHVPIFQQTFAGLGTTHDFLEECLPLFAEGVLFEVETYTWEVLPPKLRCGSVGESIVRELCWLKEQLNAAHRRP
jgi:hypothetical protein